MHEVLRTEGQALLQYNPASGYPPLRRYLADYLVRKGLVVTEADILIVNGSQQGLDLVARTFWIPATAWSSRDRRTPELYRFSVPTRRKC